MSDSAKSTAEPAENRRYHRATVLWPATLLCRNNAFDCVIFNISANGAKVMIRNSLEVQQRVTLCSPRFGEIEGRIIWRGSTAIGVQFVAPPEEVAKLLGGLPLLPAPKPKRSS